MTRAIRALARSRMLEKLDQPEDANPCGNGNASDDRGAQQQNHNESN
jgi:hypothetical protein